MNIPKSLYNVLISITDGPTDPESVCSAYSLPLKISLFLLELSDMLSTY